LFPLGFSQRVGPWWTRIRPTAHYLMETEAHVYALAVSASTLLAFYPFMTVMLSLCRDVLHWPAAMQAIYLALGDFFAGEPGEFLVRNLQPYLVPKLHWVSMLLLLFTANGIFEPLEVALNRAWGVEKNRTYLKNQLISLGLIFACGSLTLLSLMLTASNTQWIASLTATHAQIALWLNVLAFKLAALPISILALFLIYWLLPNRPVDPRRVAPVAVVVGLVMELLKYVNLLIWPWLSNKLEHEYGVFEHSATILIWSFVVAMVVLGGAHWTARKDHADPLA
jgi:YihY family inner membrane protein